jgi:tetratricopeptide (TPR) repeat protein
MSNLTNVDNVVADFLKRLDFDSVIAVCTKEIDVHTAKIKTWLPCSKHRNALAKNSLYCGYARLFIDKKDCTNFDEAIADCSNAITIRKKAEPNEPLLSTVYRIRALAYYLKGDYERALADCKAVVDPNNGKGVKDVAFIRELRVKIYYSQGKYDDAIKECKRSIASSQSNSNDVFSQNIFPSLSLVELYRDSRKKLQHRD